MPRHDELPDDMKALAFLDFLAWQISDANFDAEVSAIQDNLRYLLAQQGRVKEAEEAYREAL